MNETDYCAGLVVLTPEESKRVIAKGVVALPSVKHALETGKVIIATGSTNAFVAEELIGDVFDKEQFMTGNISAGGFGPKAEPGLQPFVLEHGEVSDVPWQQALEQFDADDVFIKGANAVDSEGFAGILIGHPTSGTIGEAYRAVVSKGAQLVVPVGLEKMIPSVLDASRSYTGTRRVKYYAGARPAGFMPIVNAEVVTEIQALEHLFGVEVTHVASGGIRGSEGSVTLLIEGIEGDVRDCIGFVEQIKR